MSRRKVALLLDEMFAPGIAAELGRRGHDVVAVAAEPQLRAMTDAELYAWAAQHGRRIVTENVKDFRRLAQMQEGPAQRPGLLFTSSRTFPRSRRHLGPLVNALDDWASRPDAARRPPEDWLQPGRVHDRPLP